MTKLRIGTRGSGLALRQARLVEKRLLDAFTSLETRIELIRTTGDMNPLGDLSRMGGKGVFVKEIEEALLSGRIDVAVHSMKDLPSVLPPGLAAGSALRREDPRDVFVSKDGRAPGDLPDGARIGTGSERRKSQLLRAFPGLRVVSLRGNVDTRLEKVLSGELDGIVLAAAGLKRLGLSGNISLYFPRDFMVPAPCQGIVAVEYRENDAETRNLVSKIVHRDTETEAAFERSFLRTFGGDCSVPLGCCAMARDGKISAGAVFVDAQRNRIFGNAWRCDAKKAAVEGSLMAKDLVERAGISL